jgi:hypothetical protein
MWEMWEDALDALTAGNDVELGLRLARESQHPDGLWLAALFPPGVAVTRAHAEQVVLEQGEDPRAMCLAWQLCGTSSRERDAMVRRAAEMGYAPAQTLLSQLISHHTPGEKSFLWAVRGAEQGYRHSICHLAHCFRLGEGCKRDDQKALDLYWEAAELGHAWAQVSLSRVGFGALHWERYLWWGRAAMRGVERDKFYKDIFKSLPAFEKGNRLRILHTVAPVVKITLDDARQSWFGKTAAGANMGKLERVVQLHEAMLGRARRAIDCWSVAGRRCGLVRDVRLMIARMAWDEPWRWS